MRSTTKTVVMSTPGSLVLFPGFVPECSAVSKLKEQIASLTQSPFDVQSPLNLSQTRLELSSFAVQSADDFSQAEATNDSVASAVTSSFFTDLREYVDQSSDGQVKQQLQEVRGARDRTIAGVAQADPAVSTLLLRVLTKLESASDDANGAAS